MHFLGHYLFARLTLFLKKNAVLYHLGGMYPDTRRDFHKKHKNLWPGSYFDLGCKEHKYQDTLFHGSTWFKEIHKNAMTMDVQCGFKYFLIDWAIDLAVDHVFYDEKKVIELEKNLASPKLSLFYEKYDPGAEKEVQSYLDSKLFRKCETEKGMRQRLERILEIATRKYPEEKSNEPTTNDFISIIAHVTNLVRTQKAGIYKIFNQNANLPR